MTDATAYRLIYSTAPSRDEAISLARALLAEKLVACVNILDGAISLYPWEGALQQTQEVILLAKTTAERADAAIARLAILHAYDCPCITSLPLAEGHAPFLQWIEEAVAAA